MIVVFKNEWKRLFNNKILLISSIVILFIPILYGAFFLKSVWDPYGKTGDLPVAVVNHDAPVNYEGKTLEVGDELVSNLKKNNDLDWNFVSASEAEKGLDNGKYYMIVTIPKDFSKNASTILDDNPKKMDLTYKINPSQNYIGEVVTQQGANQLKNEVATSVTKEYAKSVFAKIKEVGAGMTEAADGAQKLNDGASKLSDGNKTITENLNKLAKSTLTFKNGAESANDGAAKLQDGADQINVAVGQAIGGAGKLTDGANKIANGANDLNSGQSTFSGKLNQYTNGVSQSADGTAQLYPAMSQLNGGLGQLQGQLPALSGGVNQLASGQKDLNSGISQLVSGLDQAAQNVEASIKEGNSTETQNNIKALETGVAQLEAGIAQLNANVNATGTGDNNALSKQLTTLKSGLETLKLSNTSSYDSAIDQGVNQAIQQAGIDPNSEEARTIIAAAKQGAKSGASSVNTAQNQEIDKALTQITNSLPSMKALSEGIAELNGGAPKVTAGVNTLTTSTQNSLAKMQTLADGLNQLKAGAVKAESGSTQLVSGTSQLQAKVPTLSNGVNKLSDGSQQITTGLGSLNGGLQTLSRNNGALNGASAQLAAGSATLSNGANALSGGLNQLSAQLPTLHAGTNALSNGLTSLSGGIAQLSSGAGQISDGSQQLADGSETLGTGLNQVGDGSKELSEKLGDGAEQVNDTKATDKTFNMFATPTKLSEEKISEVPNYGHGLAPYVLSLGLYVGALVFNFIFPIRRPSMTPTSGLSWWFSKFSIGFVAAVLQAIILDVIMLMLGLGVENLAQFITISILTSLTYMFLVMFLAMSFGNPGRFIAMVLLVLQLGGAGGTFPMPLTNSFFNFIHPFLPMSYSVYGFRQAISAGLGNTVFVHSAIILFVIFIAFNLLLIGTMYLRKNKRFKTDSQSLIEQEA
ncbi:YhgE/Pip family protein [Listeria sp. ILCC796]|uniref:YhgE/Pip family protein n=1 Tax=unclassified Listeria TaxID=2642072 RepID=UPI003515CDEE